jgi:hypothetical protein
MGVAAGATDLAQVVVIGYNGRAPRKEEVHLDIPVSLGALQLVLLNRGVIHASNRQERRVADSVLYGPERACRAGGPCPGWCHKKRRSRTNPSRWCRETESRSPDNRS